MTASETRSNRNETWSYIFKQIAPQILSGIAMQGFFDITANQLRKFSAEVSGPDVRNLVKFDRSSSLPDVFKSGLEQDSSFVNSTKYLNIIPLGNIKQGEYVYRLGIFNAYAPLVIDDSAKPEVISFPNFETITPDFIAEKGVSENTYIDLAASSHMLDKAFNASDSPLMPVMHGRLRSGDMNFMIGTNPSQLVHAGSSQIEVDATFENNDDIVIIEAKAVPEHDFLVRQLFYPYYVIHNRGVSKRIRPSFMLIQEGTFYFNEYEFVNPRNYSTIHQVSQRTFRFAQSLKLTIGVVREVLKSTPLVPEPTIPFPQADSRSMFVKTLSLMNDADENAIDIGRFGGVSPKNIADALGYDVRQGGYYGNLVLYFGLCDKSGKEFIINSKGKKLLAQFDSNIGRLEFIKLLCSHAPFRAVIECFLDGNNMQFATTPLSSDAREELAKRIRAAGGMYHVESESTIYRRLQTVVALIKSAIFEVLED